MLDTPLQNNSAKTKSQTVSVVARETKKATSIEYKKIIDEINKTKLELETANQNFEFATDPLLVDMYTYQIKASQVKYSYLLGEARKMGVLKKAYLEDAFLNKITY